MTSIEVYDKESAEYKALKEGKTYHFPYNRGTMRNIKEVLGESALLWLFPTPPPGDGLQFPLKTEGKEDVYTHFSLTEMTIGKERIIDE